MVWVYSWYTFCPVLCIMWHPQKILFRRSFIYTRYFINRNIQRWEYFSLRHPVYIIAYKTALHHFGFMWKGFVAVYEEITLYVRLLPARNSCTQQRYAIILTHIYPSLKHSQRHEQGWELCFANPMRRISRYTAASSPHLQQWYLLTASQYTRFVRAIVSFL